MNHGEIEVPGLETAWNDAIAALSDRESTWIEVSGPFAGGPFAGGPFAGGSLGAGHGWYRAVACGLLPARFEGRGGSPAEALADLAHHLWTARPAIQEWQTTFTRLEPDDAWTDTFAPRPERLLGTFERLDGEDPDPGPKERRQS